jgi:hypothetical protein
MCTDKTFSVSAGYILVYEILHEYYIATEIDDLGAMLGDFDPDSWPPNKKELIVSGDPATYAIDWTNAWNKIIGKNKNGSTQQIFKVAKVLLDYYSNEVEYGLGDTVYHLQAKLLETDNYGK